MKQLFINIAVFCLLGIVSCADDPQVPPSTLSFQSDIVYVSEFDGTFYVPVVLDKPQFTYCDFNVGIYFDGESTNMADFGTIYNPPIIFGSELSINVTGSVVDDTLKDGNDTLRFTLTDLTSNLVLPVDEEKQSGRLVVVDDDKLPDNEMLIQLKWVATGARINKLDADFSLQMITDVVLADDGSPDDFSIYKANSKAGTFKSITIDDTAPDQEYYFIISYKSRSNLITGEANPILKLTGFGMSDREGGNRWRFSFKKDEVGYYTWLGPFKKTGRIFAPAWE